jgi:hypothetical protein
VTDRGDYVGVRIPWVWVLGDLWQHIKIRKCKITRMRSADSNRIDHLIGDELAARRGAMSDSDSDGHMFAERAEAKSFQSIFFTLHRGLLSCAGKGGRCKNTALGIRNVELGALEKCRVGKLYEVNDTH